jgi:hypothetical protein
MTTTGEAGVVGIRAWDGRNSVENIVIVTITIIMTQQQQR